MTPTPWPCAFSAHCGQSSADSEIAHARRVADAVRDEGGDDATYAAALLHDVVERGGMTSAELLSSTGDPEVVRLVDLLTRADGEEYRDYLVRCCEDPRAVLIKRADLIDKFDRATQPSAVKAEKIRRKAEQRLVRLHSLANG